MKISKTYTETEYNILNTKYERLIMNIDYLKTDYNNSIIKERKKSNWIINDLKTQIKELNTPLYIRLIKGSYDSLFFIFLGVTFLYFFFHFITL